MYSKVTAKYSRKKSSNQSSDLKIILAAIIGHILEFYDFTIYAVFSVQLGKLFFPHDSSIIQLLSSLGVFAVGFFMRPIGGIIFGHIGDKHGRRTALTISVVGMALATFVMGLLPDYSSIGVLAPLLLIFCRLLQGLCVGGEGAGASIFVLEHLRVIGAGLVGGIVNSALTIGILLAILSGIIFNAWFNETGNAWRYAFVLGGLFGTFGLYIRLNIEETPVFQEIIKQKKIETFPILKVLKTRLPNVILTIAVGSLTSSIAYVIMTYLNIFFNQVLLYDSSTALIYSAFANVCLVILLPIMGSLSDRYGYTKTIITFSIATIIFSVPLYMMLAASNIFVIYFAMFCLSLLGAGIYAPLYPFMFTLFTPEQRYSGIAFSLNIGVAIFGGTYTMISLYLINITEILYAPALYLNCIIVMFLITLFIVKHKYLFRGKNTMEGAKEISG